MNTEQRKERMVCVCAYFMFHVKFAKYAVKEKMVSLMKIETLKCSA